MLHYYLCFGIFFTKFGGRTTLAFLEKAVKIGERIKAAGESDLRDGFVGIH